MANRREQGSRHEDRAADHLIQAGFVVVTRRFKANGGEIDIIALEDDVLVFVEVKFRTRGAPESAVGFTKVQRFNEAVTAYLDKTNSNSAKVRYDLVAMTPTEIRHYRGAFQNK